MQIVITSHGELCEGMIKSYQMVAGSTSHLHTIKLDDNGIESYSSRLFEYLDSATIQNQVLILCDLEGGTPYNEAYKYYLMHPQSIRIISGVNLPMLIEVSFAAASTTDIDELVNIAIEAGMCAIKSAQPENLSNEEIDF